MSPDGTGPGTWSAPRPTAAGRNSALASCSSVSGGWARLRAVPTSFVARAPEAARAERLAAVPVPVPVTSALRAVRRLGSLLGRRLLVVGANSAVGSAAVQIGVRSGADVIAVARNTGTHAWLRWLGASQTRTDVRDVPTRVHGTIDVVGGPQLVAAHRALESGGTVVALGHSAAQEERFPYGACLADGNVHDTVITSFFVGSEPGLDSEMAWCAGEVHAGRIATGPLDVRSWTGLQRWVADGAPRPHGRVVFRVD